MSDPTVIHDTFTLERTFEATVEKVFAFLADPQKKKRWYAAADERDLEGFEMDFRVGGVERLASRMGDKTPFAGAVLANEGRFEDILDNRRVVVSTSMTLGGRRISTSLVTFEVMANGAATDMVLTHQACFYEGADGPQMRRGGWEALLSRLGQAIAA
jgi:uncharacterized protein YndB with AHSA1/START domain